MIYFIICQAGFMPFWQSLKSFQKDMVFEYLLSLFDLSFRNLI